MLQASLKGDSAPFTWEAPGYRKVVRVSTWFPEGVELDWACGLCGRKLEQHSDERCSAMMRFERIIGIQGSSPGAYPQNHLVFLLREVDGSRRVTLVAYYYQGQIVDRLETVYRSSLPSGMSPGEVTPLNSRPDYYSQAVKKGWPADFID